MKNTFQFQLIGMLRDLASERDAESDHSAARLIDIAANELAFFANAVEDLNGIFEDSDVEVERLKAALQNAAYTMQLIGDFGKEKGWSNAATDMLFSGAKKALDAAEKNKKRNSN